MSQVPSLGRVVHYVHQRPKRNGGQAVDRAAIISEVVKNLETDLPHENGTCYLTVFLLGAKVDGNSTTVLKADYDPEKKPGTWHWPEFVAPVGGTEKPEPKPKPPHRSGRAGGKKNETKEPEKESNDNATEQPAGAGFGAAETKQ